MKTGKIHTGGSYDQVPEGDAIRIAQWDSTAQNHPEALGMIRYNTEEDRVELRTIQGWRAILTSKDIGSGDGDSIKEGIIRKVQTAKKIKQVSFYFQGSNTGSAPNLIDYTAQPNQDAAQPSWLTKVTNTASDGVSYTSKLNNEGDNVYLFQDDGSSRGTNGCMMYVDVPELLGIDDNDKYNWRYNIVSGLNGYGVISMYSADLNARIRCLPSHEPPSPDLTDNNDTSPNYGRFTVICRFQYGTSTNKTTQYNGNFNLLVLAKKFKGF